MAEQMAVAQSQQMGVLLIGVEKLTPLISRFQICKALHLQEQQSEQENWEQAVKTSNFSTRGFVRYSTMFPCGCSPHLQSRRYH